MEPSATDACALIPAGGRSSRFGADKIRHIIDGKTMIGRVHAAVSAVAHPVFLGLAGQDVSPALPQAPIVVDDPPGIGPLGSLCAMLGRSPTSWVIVVAADLPYVTEHDLRQLLAARTNGIQAVVARDSSGRTHPLCACYHVDALPVMHRAVQAQRYALHGVLGKLAVRSVQLPNESLQNINRPDDLLPPHPKSLRPL